MVSEPAYRGLVARTYDLFDDETDEAELGFYRERIAEFGEPVLEVGCGTGRLLLPYLVDGADIDGVDNAPEMLELCARKAADVGVSVGTRLFLQSMDALDLPRRYRTILVPASSLQLLTARSDQLAALRCFHDALEPRGALVMFLAKLWPGERAAARQAEWHQRGVAPAPDGGEYRVFGRTRYDVDRRLNHDEERYERLVDGVVVETELHSSTMQWFELPAVEQLLADAGFGEIRTHHGFTDESARPDSGTFHVVARRRRVEPTRR